MTVCKLRAGKKLEEAADSRATTEQTIRWIGKGAQVPFLRQREVTADSDVAVMSRAGGLRLLFNNAETGYGFRRLFFTNGLYSRNSGEMVEW